MFGAVFAAGRDHPRDKAISALTLSKTLSWRGFAGNRHSLRTAFCNVNPWPSSSSQNPCAAVFHDNGKRHNFFTMKSMKDMKKNGQRILSAFICGSCCCRFPSLVLRDRKIPTVSRSNTLPATQHTRPRDLGVTLVLNRRRVFENPLLLA